MRADPRFTGKGVTIAVVDAGFHPHADLTLPANRIRAMVDAGGDSTGVELYGPNDAPAWPGWNANDGSRWHGLMTSATVAGNGFASRGLYRGLAPDAELVLIRARDSAGRITSASILRALRWLADNHDALGIRVASISLGGDPSSMLATDRVDDAVATLVDRGLVVIVAAGNDGQRHIVPPATAPLALTVGGLDDRNVFDAAARSLWHSNFGATWLGADKPDLVAPSVWVAAPVLPGTDVAREAATLFTRRALGDESCEARIAELKLITPHYQHVEGTSFAAPIVAGIAACMLEANPSLTPRRIRELLVLACRRVDGAPVERQGAGAIDAGCAVALAFADSPDVAYAAIGAAGGSNAIGFVVHAPDATSVRLLGSWNSWSRPGTPASRLSAGSWRVTVPSLGAGQHAYKFVVDDEWIADPLNRSRASDGLGGWNSVFSVA
jgi:serine protease AprX